MSGITEYFELLEKFNEHGWLIKDVRSQQYQETYTVECNESLLKFDLYHNESGVFKPVHFHPGCNDNEQLKSLIDEVVPWKYSLNYQPQTEALNSLHQNILEAITESQCSIMHVDDSNLKGYQLSYVLRTKAQGAYLQFYFNGQDVFTSIIAKSLIGEDDLQLRQVINHLLQSN